jgi:phosphoribosyl 1,2-cyclic phosphodiesterase
MPGHNGFHVCRFVQAQADLRNTKVIVMSGRDYATDRDAAADAGATEYLVKPFTEKTLLDALARQTAKPPEEVKPPAESKPPADSLPGASGAEAKTIVRFWGVRGSIPTPGPSTVMFGGNTSCVEVRADGEIIVFDAGTGIRGLGMALAKEFKDEPLHITLLITHTHWDHIQGFPFFAPAYGPKNRLCIRGYEGSSASLNATLAGQMESPYFPIPLKHMPGNIVIEEEREMKFEIGPIHVQTCFLKHPGICVGYRLFTSAGSVVYIPDNEWSKDEVTAVKTGGPCAPENDLIEFIRGADVIMLDSQYTREEYKSHIGWGHGCVDDVVYLAITAEVKQLYLFHHDPAHDDQFMLGVVEHARALAKSLGSSLFVDAAREGGEVVLTPKAAK